ncbi:uncharacterized protein LOC113472250 [Diaphorina citri]|uniref:Uncharacterized protein LOC113472250 n=1 Tax=Diaphorina citri TaxID=121845 RepID=A0A3Q0JH71_DIACI|nr:uncharacterized protein LOC113472250 [Diaphorina citri]
MENLQVAAGESSCLSINYKKSKSFKQRGNKESKPQQQHYDIKNCTRCSGNHARNKCPAYGAKCLKCGFSNHFAKCCKFKKAKDAACVLMENENEQEDFFIGANDQC